MNDTFGWSRVGEYGLQWLAVEVLDNLPFAVYNWNASVSFEWMF